MAQNQDDAPPAQQPEPVVERVSSAPPRPGGLASITAVRREIANVYRDSKTYNLPPSDGTKLVYMLQTLIGAIGAESKDDTADEQPSTFDWSRLNQTEVDAIENLMKKGAGELDADAEVIPATKNKSNGGSND